MKLYSAKIPIIARDVLQELITAEDIEVNNREEAELDIQAVLKEYLRTDREITERAKDIMEQRSVSHSQFSKIKRTVADDKGFGLGEDGIIWMCNQLLESFMHSQFIEEIYASDAEMRKKMRAIFRKHMMVDEELDVEVRQRIQNLEEGTANWDIEYAKVMDQIKQKHGLKK